MKTSCERMNGMERGAAADSIMEAAPCSSKHASQRLAQADGHSLIQANPVQVLARRAYS